MVAGSRPAIACIVLWLLTWISGGVTSRQAIAGRVRLRLMGVGVCTGAQIFLLYQSVERISAPLAVLLLYSYPALVALLSVVFLHERLRPVRVAAIAISLAGAVLIVGLPAGRATPAGCLYGLGAGLCLAIYIILVSRVARGIRPAAATAWVQLGAAIIFVPGLISVARVRPAPAAAGWLLLVGFSAAVATALFLTGVQRLSPTTASIAATVEPVSTAMLGAVLLGLTLTGWQLAGGLLIVAALAVTALDGSRNPGAAAVTAGPVTTGGAPPCP